MIWSIIFSFCIVVSAFSFIISLIAFFDKDAPKYTMSIFLANLALTLYFINGFLVKKTTNTHFLVPKTHYINEKDGIAYFYAENVVVETQEYKFIKNAQNVIIIATQTTLGHSFVTTALPVTYLLSTNNTPNVEN